MADLRIAFAGTPIFARTILAALCQSNLTPQLVLTQPDRPKGRGRALQASPVKQLAQELVLPIEQPVTLRDRENLQLLEQAAPDVLVVAAEENRGHRRVVHLILSNRDADACDPQRRLVDLHTSVRGVVQGAVGDA